MTELLRELLKAVDERRPVVSATVVSTHRSVPRRAGSKMLVYADGTTSGSVGGGEMESRVCDVAKTVLESRRPTTLSYALVDPASGDPGVCGGEVELYLEPHMPTTTIYVVGAGHVGHAIVELASWLGYRVVVWDDRPELLDGMFGADGQPVTTVTGTITEALAAQPIDAHTRVVMVTRNVGLDVEIMPALLASEAPTIGLMGSGRRWDTTRAKLIDAGVDGALFDKVHSPLGVEIAAETPKEIAVSVLAEVIGHERQ